MNRAVYVCITLAALIFPGNLSAQLNKDIEIAKSYHQEGDHEKAVDLFKKLAKEPENIKLIHKPYFESLLAQADYRQAERYLEKAIKDFPDEMRYRVDYGYLLKIQDQKEQMESYFGELINEQKDQVAALRYLSVHMLTYQFYPSAERALEAAKRKSKEGFYVELAELYRLWGKSDLMVTNLLNLLEEDRAKMPFVQGQLSDYLSDEDYAKLEDQLVSYAQKNTASVTFNRMLVWYYLQREDYYMAYTQARTVDRRLGGQGREVLEVGELAFAAEEFETASQIFDFVIRKYPNTESYQRARTLAIQAREAIVKSQYPVDRSLILQLVQDYEAVIEDIGMTAYTADAVQNLALLEAFYLDNKENAIKALESLINSNRIPSSIINRAKLVLGDIYLLQNEPWEASLIYSQVEKASKETPLGHDAKLKNAKLSYYVGDFELAKSHLDVLKMATSREIANDAMDLSLLIQDNLELDTSSAAMEQYALVDLLIFQNKIPDALEAYDTMLAKYKNHSLTDEILYEKSKLLVKLGKFEQAIKELEKILENYKTDILADDANFMIGEIYEQHLMNEEKAMEYYQNQFTKPEFDGSMYIVEARKRFRRLRGDKVY